MAGFRDGVAPWLGRRWIERDYECAGFAREVLAEEFGVTASWGRPGPSVRAKDRQVEEFIASGAVERLSAPCDGCLVLMRDRRGRRLAGWHVGVWWRGACLHLPADGTSMYEPPWRLKENGLEIEGYYRCR